MKEIKYYYCKTCKGVFRRYNEFNPDTLYKRCRSCKTMLRADNFEEITKEDFEKLK
jgi:NAD-dependent SIR2 family protein deacetylase